MTAPAPGFPPELETAITEALAGHIARQGMFGSQHLCKKCDQWYDDDASFAAHQAAVVMEVIAQHTTTEWGAIDPGETDPNPDCVSTDRAWVIDECIAGIYEADEEHPRLVFHLVLPWQEVKA